MENTSDSFMPRPLLFCLKSGRSVCYSVPDNNQERQTNGFWTPCVMSSRKKVLKKKSAESARKRLSTGGNTQDIMYGHLKHLHCSKPFQMENI